MKKHLYAPLEDIKLSQLIFVMLWVVYATAYIGRLNYAASIATIVSQGIMDKSQAGLIGTIYFFCYGGGQLINGIITDRFSPFKIIIIGLTGSATANLLMFFNSNYIIMAVIWGFNGFMQAMLWAPTLFIISNILHTDLRYKACLYIAATFPIGTLMAYFTAMVCSNFKWNSVFAVAPAVMYTVVILFCVTYNKVRKKLVYQVSTVEKPVERSNIKIKKILTMSGASLILFSVMLHGMLKEGIMTWVPTMITETYDTTPTFSIFLTMILPVVNLSGAYIATFILKKFTKNNEALAAMIVMGFTVLPLSVLLLIGKIPLLVSIIMLAMITASMVAFNHIFAVLAPLRFKNFNRTATMAGILNSTVYLGCSISTYSFGFLSNVFGWRNSIFFWIGIAVTAVFFCLVSLKTWKKFINTEDI